MRTPAVVTVAVAVAVAACCSVTGVMGVERFYDGDPIDYSAGLSRAAGVVVAYRERVWDFVRDSQLDLHDIEWAVRAKEWDELRRFCARLEADADAVGARGVRLYAEQLKILSRVKRPGKVRATMEQLTFEVKVVIEFVKNDKRFERTQIKPSTTAAAADAAPAAAAPAAPAPAAVAPAAAAAAASAAAPATPPHTEL